VLIVARRRVVCLCNCWALATSFHSLTFLVIDKIRTYCQLFCHLKTDEWFPTTFKERCCFCERIIVCRQTALKSGLVPLGIVGGVLLEQVAISIYWRPDVCRRDSVVVIEAHRKHEQQLLSPRHFIP
jgi:hypothetical protein